MQINTNGGLRDAIGKNYIYFVDSNILCQHAMDKVFGDTLTPYINNTLDRSANDIMINRTAYKLSSKRIDLYDDTYYYFVSSHKRAKYSEMHDVVKATETLLLSTYFDVNNIPNVPYFDTPHNVTYDIDIEYNGQQVGLLLPMTTKFFTDQVVSKKRQDKRIIAVALNRSDLDSFTHVKQIRIGRKDNIAIVPFEDVMNGKINVPQLIDSMP